MFNVNTILLIRVPDFLAGLQPDVNGSTYSGTVIPKDGPTQFARVKMFNVEANDLLPQLSVSDEWLSIEHENERCYLYVKKSDGVRYLYTRQEIGQKVECFLSPKLVGETPSIELNDSYGPTAEEWADLLYLLTTKSGF